MESTTFTDKHGRAWSIPPLSLWHVKQLREADLDIEDIIQQGYLWADHQDAWMGIGRACWALCSGQHEVGEDEFFRAWDGDTFGGAQEALLHAIVNFTRSPRKEAIQNVAEGIQAAQVNVMKSTIRQRKAIELILQATYVTEDQLSEIESILSESAMNEREKPVLATLSGIA